jgi:uncharacterized protein (TIGR00297 family)
LDQAVSIGDDKARWAFQSKEAIEGPKMRMTVPLRSNYLPRLMRQRTISSDRSVNRFNFSVLAGMSTAIGGRRAAVHAQPAFRFRHLTCRCRPSSGEESKNAGDGKNEEVDRLLSKAHEAVAVAENTVEHIEELPSARLPTAFDKMIKCMIPASKVLVLVVYCRAIHSFGLVTKILGGIALAGAVGLRGYRKSSLSPSGALAAAAVGCATISSSFRAGLVLLGFYFASSFLTSFGDEDKDVDEGHKKGGQRNWVQVYSNGGIPAVLAMIAALISVGKDLAVFPVAAHPAYSLVATAFLGFIACCAGDTWSSEIGQLSQEEPRLITTLRPVRKGTNGGVTLIGLLSSCLGGLFVGILFYLTGILSPGNHYSELIGQWKLIPLGLGAGLVGSLTDSILGATVQFTGYNRKTGKITGKAGPDVSPISGSALLDNNGVNIVSASLTALLAATCAPLL